MRVCYIDIKYLTLYYFYMFIIKIMLPNFGCYFPISSSSGVAKVLVSNLPAQIRVEELDLLFSNYGQVQNIEKVPSRDPNTQSVLISYETQEQVQQYVISTLFYLLFRERSIYLGKGICRGCCLDLLTSFTRIPEKSRKFFLTACTHLYSELGHILGL